MSLSATRTGALVGLPFALGLLLLLGSCGGPDPELTGPGPVASPTTPHLGTPSATPPPGSIPLPPDRDLVRIAERLRAPGGVPALASPEPPRTGQQEKFWVMDLAARRVGRTTATLRLVTPSALWYVDPRVTVSDEDLEAAAQAFEQQVYPRVTQTFGGLGLPPGERMGILHTRLRGAQAYVGTVDRYPPWVHPYSNQRPLIYMSVSGLRVGGRRYMATVAHELQHLIHSAADPTEVAWVNEGLSELASAVAGYPVATAPLLSGLGTVSLTRWPDTSPDVGRHYAAAHSFFRYLTQHYGSPGDLTALLQEPADGAAGIEGYLAGLGAPADFRDVFGAWTIANLLGTRGPGLYGYKEGAAAQTPPRTLRSGTSVEGRLEPFASDYIRLRPDQGTATIRFRGEAMVPIMSATIPGGGHCWWGNQGDSIHTRLTRELDLRAVGQATLAFRVWYDIERSWDYAYVTASSDGGRTWAVLAGDHTQETNPLGNAFGPGLTGTSAGWVSERVDLTPFAGSRTLVSFEYVTDDAVNLDGLCIDDISVPEIGFFDDAEADTGWDAQGFVRTDNVLAQEYLVHLVELPRDGDPVVRRMPLGPDNTGLLQVEWDEERLEEAVVIISPVTQVTSQATSYTLTLSQND